MRKILFMGNSVTGQCIQNDYNVFYKQVAYETYNKKVAMWHLPSDSRYKQYDEDGSKWFESSNKNGNNEIEEAEKGLGMRLTRYTVQTKTTWYDDNSYDVESKYPNNNTVIENHGENHVFIKIKDAFNRLVADKVFGFNANDGKKTIYKNYTNGNDTFSVARVYSFDTTKNRATDVVNYGYTSDETKLTNGCNFEKEYYLLNGKQVEVQKNENGEIIINKEDGKILTFQVE